MNENYDRNQVDQVKEEIKRHLKEYAEETGRPTGKRLFNCFLEDHEDKDASMQFKGTYYKCFGCDRTLDIFSLYALDNNLDERQDFPKIKKELADKYKIPMDFKPKEPVTRQPKEENKLDFSSYYKKCKKDVEKTNYLAIRGIPEELIDKYNIGYDEKEKRVIFPLSKSSYVARSTETRPKIKHYKPKGSMNVIFNEHYIKNSDFKSVVWVTESVIDALSLEAVNKDIKAVSLNSTSNAMQLVEEAKKSDYKGCFILALDTDASGIRASEELKEQLENLGIKAVVFNSNKEKYFVETIIEDYVKDNDFEEIQHYFLKQELEKNKPNETFNALQIKAGVFFRVITDLDFEISDRLKDTEQGLNTTRDLKEYVKKALDKKGLYATEEDLKEQCKQYKEILERKVILENKDINEYYLADANKLEKNVSYFDDQMKSFLKQEARKLLEEENALNYLGEFNRITIDDELKTPTLTGILRLDKALYGGFYKKNLIILGASSGAGKTTLALQIADNIADNGQDVLFFSLEMSKEEIIAKSLSRLMFLEDKKNNGKITLAKNCLSFRQILMGKMNEEKTPKETQQLYASAYNYYKERIAKNLFINECNENNEITIEEIEARIKKQIEVTEKKPFVVIDYLQIIENKQKGLTDIQATGKIVKDLKRLARKYKISILVISAFNRTSNYTDASYNSFRDTSTIEYTADVLLSLQLSVLDSSNDEEETKAGAFKSDKKIKRKVAEAKKKEVKDVTLKILKNRNGVDKTLSFINFYGKNNYFDFLQFDGSKIIED